MGGRHADGNADTGRFRTRPATDGRPGSGAFDAFVTRVLVPTLHRGDIVVLDNLSVHKSAVAQRATEAAGASLLFLPAYSPDFTPIEQAFATLKQHLRTVNARTVETVMAATRELYPRITATDACSFFHHAGYFF